VNTLVSSPAHRLMGGDRLRADPPKGSTADYSIDNVAVFGTSPASRHRHFAAGSRQRTRCRVARLGGLEILGVHSAGGTARSPC